MRISLLMLIVTAVFAHTALAQPPQSDENGTTFDAPGARIYFHTVGSAKGAPLVVVNGGPGFDHTYLHCSNVWAEFGKTHRVVLYDQRGNGRSPAQADAALTLGAQIDDLDAVRAHIGADRMDLMGHSWGGYLAMAYAARHPEHVAHLVIVDSAAPKWSETITLFEDVFPETMAQRRSTNYANVLGDAAAAAENIRLYLTMLFYSPEKRQEFMANASNYHYTSAINQAVNRDLARYDLNPELEKFRFPALVVTGRFDMNVAPLTAVKIHNAIRGSKFLVFERSGHLPFFEEPEAFLQAVELFLAK